MPVMDLDQIIIRPQAGRHESLAPVLQAVAEAAGGTIDYDCLCAAMGVSFSATFVPAEPRPSRWMSYGRDAFVEPAARLFGIELRNMHPPDVGMEMVAAAEFAQHFEASYKPLVQRALEHGQPVIAWQGWPDDAAVSWGIITGMAHDQFTGVVSCGTSCPLVAPALQCYVVEQCRPQSPAREALVAMAARHARAYLSDSPLLSPASHLHLSTGPAALEAWARFLQSHEQRSGVAESLHSGERTTRRVDLGLPSLGGVFPAMCRG